MKVSTLIATILVIFMLMTVTTSQGKKERDLHITSLSIQFNKTDAIFTANYDFDKVSKTFLLILGSKNIEPKVKSFFSNFDYEVIKIDQDKAILRVKHISVLDKGYYLHRSRKFGDTIERVYISDPSDFRIREYYNINQTPDYFYESESR